MFLVPRAENEESTRFDRARVDALRWTPKKEVRGIYFVQWGHPERVIEAGFLFGEISSEIAEYLLAVGQVFSYSVQNLSCDIFRLVYKFFNFKILTILAFSRRVRFEIYV